MAALQISAPRDEDGQDEEMREAWNLFMDGEEGNGITVGTLERVARRLKIEVGERELGDMIKEAGGEGGVVGREGFENVMRRAGGWR